MQLNNFNDLLEKLKEIVPDYEQTNEDYSFQINTDKCDLLVEVNSQFFYVKIGYKQEFEEAEFKEYQKELSYQGVFHPLTFFYIYTMFNAIKNYPNIFIGVFFGSQDTKLNVLMERLQFAIIEYDAFLKNFVESEWNGEAIKVKGLKNCEIMVEINTDAVPYISATFSKSDFVFERTFTVWEWLLLFVEDMSWLEADDFTLRVKDLPKPPKETKGYIGQILEHYGANIKLLGDDYIDVPIGNQYVLKVLVFYNDLGIVVKLYTSNRPFDSYDIKIPYRHNIIDNLNYLSKVLYLIQEDKNGEYIYSLLNYFDTIKDIYAKVLI